tara:strand:- start:64 stop:318 length:255 start_codon:yes stop_codon:yes gene_type:complete
MEEERNFISKWFGFSGWKVMSAKSRIGIQILYRAIFLLGLGILIIGYGYVMNDDPGGVALFGMVLVWFMLFQFIINFIFIEGSR